MVVRRVQTLTLGRLWLSHAGLRQFAARLRLALLRGCVGVGAAGEHPCRGISHRSARRGGRPHGRASAAAHPVVRARLPRPLRDRRRTRRCGPRGRPLPECGHRLGESAAGRDDVFQKAHEVARVERAFDPIRSAILLDLTAHDDERQTGRHRRRSCQRNGSESRSGEARRCPARHLAAVRGESARRAPGGDPAASRSDTCRGTSDERRPERRTKSPSSSACSTSKRAELVAVTCAARDGDRSESVEPGDPGSRMTAEPSAYETSAVSAVRDAPKNSTRRRRRSRPGTRADELRHSASSFPLRARRFFGSWGSISCAQVRRS